jgi:hypothetical protein
MDKKECKHQWNFNECKKCKTKREIIPFEHYSREEFRKLFPGLDMNKKS